MSIKFLYSFESPLLTPCSLWLSPNVYPSIPADPEPRSHYLTLPYMVIVIIATLRQYHTSTVSALLCSLGVPFLQSTINLFLFHRREICLLACFLACLVSTGSHLSQHGLKFHVAQNDPELLSLLLIPPKCWDYRHAPLHPVSWVLGMEPRASCILGKHSTNWATRPSREFSYPFTLMPWIHRYLLPTVWLPRSGLLWAEQASDSTEHCSLSF